MTVHAIAPKLGVDYPPEFLERLRAFNRSLMEKYAPVCLNLMNEIPGTKVIYINLSNPTQEELEQYESLLKEKESYSFEATFA